jgi:hypothetical protein
MPGVTCPHIIGTVSGPASPALFESENAMNVTELLQGSPELIEALLDAGIDRDKLDPLGEAIGRQLGGGPGLESLLGGLDAGSFLEKMNVTAIGRETGLPLDLVERALALVAPEVERFAPGGLDPAAGRLLGR